MVVTRWQRWWVRVLKASVFIAKVAVTKYHRSSSSNKLKLILPQFWRLKIWNQNLAGSVPFGGSKGETAQAPLLASGGCRQPVVLSLVCRRTSLSHAHHPPAARVCCLSLHPSSVSVVVWWDEYEVFAYFNRCWAILSDNWTISYILIAFQ